MPANSRDIVLADSKQIAEWAAVKADLDAKQAAQQTAELPFVREIFLLFDADEDDGLSQDEYKRYLQGIGVWDKARIYTDAGWGERWPKECDDMKCTVAAITREAFEGILYGHHRLGKAQADLEMCKEWAKNVGTRAA